MPVLNLTTSAMKDFVREISRHHAPPSSLFSSIFRPPKRGLPTPSFGPRQDRSALGFPSVRKMFRQSSRKRDVENMHLAGSPCVQQQLPASCFCHAGPFARPGSLSLSPSHTLALCRSVSLCVCVCVRGRENTEM